MPNEGKEMALEGMNRKPSFTVGPGLSIHFTAYSVIRSRAY